MEVDVSSYQIVKRMTLDGYIILCSFSNCDLVKEEPWH
jgi:hypothetical protein